MDWKMIPMEGHMRISYKPLWIKLAEREIYKNGSGLRQYTGG